MFVFKHFVQEVLMQSESAELLDPPLLPVCLKVQQVWKVQDFCLRSAPPPFIEEMWRFIVERHQG